MTDLVVLVLSMVVVAIASWWLTGRTLRRALRRGWLVHPDERSSHEHPTPSGGGAGLVAATLLGWAMAAVLGMMKPSTAVALAIPVGVLALVGWADDRRPLPASIRFLVQCIVTGWVLYVLHAVSGAAGWALLPAALAILWLTNLTNFMDGSHGLAAGQGAFAAAGLAMLFVAAGDPPRAWLAAMLAAACIGFWPWNSPIPKIFMGDVGSIPLGFVLGTLLVWGTLDGTLPPTSWLLMATFIVDSTVTLLRRVAGGERWYTAHKKHLYQRLIGNGWPHRRVLRACLAIDLLVVAPVVVIGWVYPGLVWPLTVAVTALLVGTWFVASFRLDAPP